MAEAVMRDDNDTEQGVCDYAKSWGPYTPCGNPAVFRYPAMGGGYCKLCDEHARPYACTAVIISAETWDGDAWVPSQ